MAQIDPQSLRDAANKHLWMHNRDWTETADQGGPMVVATGEGIRVTDTEGNTWIDVNGGYSSVNVGYGRKEIADAAYAQMLDMPYFPQTSTTAPTVMLAEKLAQITPGSLTRSFLVSGGSEANEMALKVARAYHKRRGEPGRHKVISRRGSYHGATGGVVWLGGGGPGDRLDYEPAPPGFLYAPDPYPYRCELGGESPSECATRCAEAVDKLITSSDPATVAAVIAEPVAAGKVPGDEYWPALRDICDRHGVILIADEIVTGFGRTGKMFGVEHWGVVPDVMAVAKGIVSSYVPIGAAIVREEVADHFAGKDNLFRHVFTFAGHPVAAAAALKNIEIIEDEGLVANSADVGGYFKEQLEGLKVDHSTVGHVAGQGLHLRVDFVGNADTGEAFASELEIDRRLNEKFKSHGLILRTGSDAMVLGPPLCITRDEVDEIVHAVDLSLWEVEGELGIGRMA